MKTTFQNVYHRNWKLLLVVLAGVVLRLHRYLDNDFWYDEALQIYECYSFGLKQFKVLIMHPPLNNTLLYFWVAISSSTLWLKLWPVIWAAGTIVCVYLVGKQLKNETAGICAAIILVVMPLHIYYSRDIRMYSLQAFLIVLSWLAFLKLAETKNARWFFTLTLTTALALYTHYFCVFPLTTLGICSLLLIKKQKGMYLNTLSLITGVVLYCPWLIRLMKATRYMMKDSDFFSPPVTLSYILKIGALILGSYSASKMLILITAVTLLLLVTFAFYKETYRLRVYILGLTVIPMVIIYLLGITLDYNYLIVRYVTFMTPLVAIATGISLSRVNHRLRWVIAVLICLPMIHSTMRLYSDTFGGLELNQGVRPHKEFSEPARIIAENWELTDVITHSCISSYTPMYYYATVENGIHAGHVIDLNDQYGDWFRKTWQVGKFIEYYPFANPVDYQVAAKGHQRMWYIASEFDINVPGTFDTDFTHTLTDYLLQRYHLIQSWSHYGCPLYLFDLNTRSNQ